MCVDNHHVLLTARSALRMGTSHYCWGLFVLSLSFISCLPPPKDPPPHLLESYTLHHQIPLERFYVDDTNNGTNSHYIYSRQQIDQMIKNSYKFYQKISNIYEGYRDQMVRDDREVDSRILLRQLRKEDWIYYALINYTQLLNHSKILVIGSTSPWVESLLLSLGAEEVTTIEYNQLTYDHPKLKTISHEHFDQFYASSNSQYDFIFSISSFDHDGLGRYGDPLLPDGDLLSMMRIKPLLKPETGLLFLTVPIGPDVIVWNLHRRYGRIRLPLLLEGWDIVDRVGWDEDLLDRAANWRQTYEPIFILKPGFGNRSNGSENLIPPSRESISGDL